jgi:hypothetical protein
MSGFIYDSKLANTIPLLLEQDANPNKVGTALNTKRGDKILTIRLHIILCPTFHGV